MLVLGVEESLSKKKWVQHFADEKLIAHIIQKFDIPEILARILVVKNLDVDVLENFLYPTLRKNLPNPETLKDVTKTAERIADSVERGETIGIMGDYDVDGATSSALLKLFLQSTGTKTKTFIPDRDDGYGPNAQKMQEFYDEGIRLVATVDCGMTAFEPIDFGTKLGLDIVIIDHHEPERMLPNAYSVVNPKRLDEDIKHPCHSMAAVGVVFLVVVAINKILRQRGFYDDKIPEPDLRQWLDLVAFGTVCDVVPLKGVNRLLVKSGLKQILANKNVGIKALSHISKIHEQITSYHLGYILGPRINAGGRVGKSDLGMRLLSTFDEVEAAMIANELEELNLLRRSIESDVLEQATKQAMDDIQAGHPFILVQGENWHQGVVGIVAGRLKERFNLPSFVLSVEGSDAKGSSRSVPGVDLGTLVITAMQKGILSRGGGHPMAAGFSLDTNRINDFRAFLKEYINTQCNLEVDKPKELIIDGVLDIHAVNLDLLDKISLLEPYGEGNEEPVFAVHDVLLSRTILTKNGHVVCKFTGKSGGYLDAVCFRAEKTQIGQTLLENRVGQYYHIAGQLRIDTWNTQKKVQMIIHDIALA
ncbi:MAG: single-stranded-DNA-specific exonuclease RecJ [Alphaproteobacteria bacterium]|nr:single-stranded-DNA-specific exonuclease RecJ [Alphaproteobacteria bacterium]